MTLIQIVISIVLSALLLTIGVFYGGGAYTNTKPQLNATEIISELNQISDAIKISRAKGLDLTPPENYSHGCDNKLDPKDVRLVMFCDHLLSTYTFDRIIDIGLLSEHPTFGHEEYVFNNSVFLDVFKSDLNYGDVISIDIDDAATCIEINNMSGAHRVSEAYEIFDVTAFYDGGGISDFSSAYHTNILQKGVMGKSIYCAKLNSNFTPDGVYRVYKITSMQYFSGLKMF